MHGSVLSRTNRSKTFALVLIVMVMISYTPMVPDTYANISSVTGQSSDVTSKGVIATGSGSTTATYSVNNTIMLFNNTSVPGNHAGSFTVKGSNTATAVSFDPYAYITGSVNPASSTVSVNGNNITLSSSGSFNVSEPAGKYKVVISDHGYLTVYSNFSLNPGQVEKINVTLKTPASSSPVFTISETELIEIIIGVAIAATAVGVVIYLKKKK